MKSSEFVIVTPKNKGVVIGEMTEHREIIKKYAEKGYCFVTVIQRLPTKIRFSF